MICVGCNEEGNVILCGNCQKINDAYLQKQKWGDEIE